jgi:3-deoxy-D-manno-octulosonic-acid transferase
MILGLYRAITYSTGPVIRLYLALRRLSGKEDPRRFSERLGVAGLARPDGYLVWIHAASVGESLSMLPLIERLADEKPGGHVLITTGTVTSAAIMAERLPGGAFHQYVPVDRPGYVNRFLEHWRPDLALWAESEFWPNLISSITAKKIPLILINGRISPASFSGWRRFPGLIAGLLAGFDLCLGQTEGDADRLRSLGAKDAKCVGNIKFAAPPLPADRDDLAKWTRGLAGRPRWLAASTHAGEEKIAGEIHRKLKSRHPGLLTLIVPRHPGRGPAVRRELGNDGLCVALRSASDAITRQTDVYIADTMGELGTFFRLAGVVFMGKSLIALGGQGGGNMGGQNPLEPARLGCAVLFGPHMANFTEIGGRMTAAGGALQVAGAGALQDAVDALLGDRQKRESMAKAARSFAEAEAGVMEKIMAELSPFIGAP